MHSTTEIAKTRLTGAEAFWYVLGCIAMGAAYFAKLPVKKALHDFGYGGPLAGAERFWYRLGCIALGGAYFAKISAAKALAEIATGYVPVVLADRG